MSVTATYLDDLSRVRLECTGAPAAADHAVIERSTDGGITWATVRGGDTVSLDAGACVLDDYEFAPGVLNTYRASYVDAADPSWVGVAAAVQADNATVNPTLPAGLVDGDVLVLMAASRSTSATVNLPGGSGWFLYADLGNFRVFLRTYTSGVIAPPVSVTGGAAGDDLVAQIGAVRNVDLTIGATGWTTAVNAAAQNIAAPGIAVGLLTPNLLVRFGWKQGISTSSSQAGWTVITRTSTTAGTGETVIWHHKTTGTDEPNGTISLSGGSAAVSKAVTMRFPRAPYLDRPTTTITPGMDRIWLKHPGRPYLNRPITVVDWSEIKRPARSGVFDVVGRSYPVAVTELRGSRRYTLTITTTSLAAHDDLDGALSAGEPVLVHVPTGCPVPGMYAIVGDTTSARPRRGRRSARRYLDLPLVEVAAPAGTLVGSTVTWQGVLNAFATWADVLAAEPTWADLLDRIGTPGDVIVP